jgi:hypothetical protein
MRVQPREPGGAAEHVQRVPARAAVVERVARGRELGREAPLRAGPDLLDRRHVQEQQPDVVRRERGDRPHHDGRQ